MGVIGSKCKGSGTTGTGPRQEEDREDNTRPGIVKSNTGAIEPKQVVPEAGSNASGRAKCLNNVVDPQCEKSVTKKGGPRRARLLKNDSKPR